ncbi:hypothetical protein SEMRO_996_G229230.1 [Seminavis robusta]|uniref:Uncharacterized protein n=1 Tax=Seminavis robusta TaxID=568900 RepID=A0A9N8EIN1_9STRA|nr:hypothetical protein SEMRO_996_G229230.1 [Seminavis robusta]|eukprot:Sro996_g229230.1 n/a (997) ;mRNA; f:4459-7449
MPPPAPPSSSRASAHDDDASPVSVADRKLLVPEPAHQKASMLSPSKKKKYSKVSVDSLLDHVAALDIPRETAGAVATSERLEQLRRLQEEGQKSSTSLMSESGSTVLRGIDGLLGGALSKSARLEQDDNDDDEVPKKRISDSSKGTTRGRKPRPASPRRSTTPPGELRKGVADLSKSDHPRPSKSKQPKKRIQKSKSGGELAEQESEENSKIVPKSRRTSPRRATTPPKALERSLREASMRTSKSAQKSSKKTKEDEEDDPRKRHSDPIKPPLSSSSQPGKTRKSRRATTPPKYLGSDSGSGKTTKKASRTTSSGGDDRSQKASYHRTTSTGSGSSSGKQRKQKRVTKTKSQEPTDQDIPGLQKMQKDADKILQDSFSALSLEKFTEPDSKSLHASLSAMSFQRPSAEAATKNLHASLSAMSFQLKNNASFSSSDHQLSLEQDLSLPTGMTYKPTAEDATSSSAPIAKSDRAGRTLSPSRRTSKSSSVRVNSTGSYERKAKKSSVEKTIPSIRSEQDLFTLEAIPEKRSKARSERKPGALRKVKSTADSGKEDELSDGNGAASRKARTTSPRRNTVAEQSYRRTTSGGTLGSAGSATQKPRRKKVLGASAHSKVDADALSNSEANHTKGPRNKPEEDRTSASCPAQNPQERRVRDQNGLAVSTSSHQGRSRRRDIGRASRRTTSVGARRERQKKVSGASVHLNVEQDLLSVSESNNQSTLGRRHTNMDEMSSSCPAHNFQGRRLRDSSELMMNNSSSTHTQRRRRRDDLATISASDHGAAGSIRRPGGRSFEGSTSVLRLKSDGAMPTIADCASVEVEDEEKSPVKTKQTRAGRYNRFDHPISPVPTRRTGRRVGAQQRLSLVSCLDTPLAEDVEKEKEEYKAQEIAGTKDVVVEPNTAISDRPARSRLRAMDLRERLNKVDESSEQPSNKEADESDTKSVFTATVVLPFAKEIPKEFLKAQQRKAKLEDSFADLEFHNGFSDLYEDESEHLGIVI